MSRCAMNAVPKKKQCAVHVAKRHYSKPGQCEKRLGLRKIVIGDTPVLVCSVHARIMQGGNKLSIAARAR
jgi:hypothetical protein